MSSTALKEQKKPRTLTVKSVREILNQNKDRWFAGLPRHITKDRMVNLSCTCLERNPDLLKCTPVSLYRSIIEAAALGLELDSGFLGHAYLVPFKNKGVMEVTLIPGYKGLIQMVYGSGEVSSLELDVVREGDVFSHKSGAKAEVEHQRSPFADRHTRTITHAYARVVLKSGGQLIKVMTRGEVDHHMRTFAQGYNRSDSPWKKHYDKMAAKTCFRQLFPLLPLRALEMRVGTNEDRLDSMTIDGEVVSQASPGLELDDIDKLAHEAAGETEPSADQQPADSAANPESPVASDTSEEESFALDAEPKELNKAQQTRLDSFAAGLKKLKKVTSIEKSAAAYYESANTKLEHELAKKLIDARIAELEPKPDGEEAS